MSAVRKTTAECLNAYLERSGEHGMQLIASFTGATFGTVRDWTTKKLPGGLYAIRLLYFLDWKGYTPAQLSNLPRPALGFGRLLAFRVLTDDEALKAAGYAQAVQIQSIYLRSANLTSHRLAVLEATVQKHAETLAAQRTYFAEHGRFPPPVLQSPAELSKTNVSFDEVGEPTGDTIATGTIEECFQEFATAAWATERHFEAAVEWVGATWHPTGRRWFRGYKLPKGMFLIKLAYYLEQVGYGVEELQKLEPEVRLFGRMMAFGVIELKEAVRQLGYSPANENAVLGAVLRGKPMSSIARENLSQVVKNGKEQLQEGVKKFHGDRGFTAPSAFEIPEEVSHTEKVAETSVPPQAPPTPMPEPVPITEDLETRAIVEIAANQIKALNPLLAVLVSDRCTAADRALLRKLAGVGMFNERGVFDLARYAQALTSEASRKHANGGD
jgi:hypothetical protein